MSLKKLSKAEKAKMKSRIVESGKLKPCLRCCSEKIYINTDWSMFFCFCGLCKSTSVRKNSEAEAIKAWNTRPAEMSEEELADVLDGTLCLIQMNWKVDCRKLAKAIRSKARVVVK